MVANRLCFSLFKQFAYDSHFIKLCKNGRSFPHTAYFPGALKLVDEELVSFMQEVSVEEGKLRVSCELYTGT